ncbi:hypothetical protein [Noviherbaspirillum galbum]|uniref:Uncharacterized protein n=1 Tax=Noviherbaspirillum galbum TaxID=2709383 RepID=A0A6B3SHI0_9BURK|nr:hypothetical protein [Noviherbaspirillum galbum]NEX60113.1 hypothetical protein [Noviherbaspirillum galbum]
MGATITCGKLASGFKRSDGTVVYVLFEQTYESNCYPHTPKWSAVAIGSYQDVMHFVFHVAAVCEGGMVRTPRGDITAQTYIKGWKRALAQPVIMPDVAVRLKISDSWRGTIDREQWEAAKARLHSTGRNDLVEELEAGREVLLSLHSDAEVIIAVYGRFGPFSPWRIVKREDTVAEVDKSLVPEPVIGRVRMPSIRMLQVSAYESEMLQSVDGGPWKLAGWRYSAIGDFVRQVAYPAEMACTGSAKAMIAAYRELMQAAPLAPRETTVTVTVSPPDVNKYRVQTATELAQKLGYAAEGQPIPAQYTVSIGELEAADPNRDKHVVYNATHLDENQCDWHVPGMVSSNGSDGEIVSSEQAMPIEQIALI